MSLATLSPSIPLSRIRERGKGRGLKAARLNQSISETGHQVRKTGTGLQKSVRAFDIDTDLNTPNGSYFRKDHSFCSFGYLTGQEGIGGEREEDINEEGQIALACSPFLIH